MPTTFGGMNRRDERRSIEGGQRVAGPGVVPVVNVHDIGSPIADTRQRRHQVAVGSGGVGDDEVFGQPRKIGVGSEYSYAIDVGIIAGFIVGAREHHDFVATPNECA